jgi:hypothetical protein
LVDNRKIIEKEIPGFGKYFKLAYCFVAPGDRFIGNEILLGNINEFGIGSNWFAGRCLINQEIE